MLLVDGLVLDPCEAEVPLDAGRTSRTINEVKGSNARAGPSWTGMQRRSSNEVRHRSQLRLAYHDALG